MKNIIFENFSLRVMSVVVAVIGWFYVNIIVNPSVERQFEIDVVLIEKRPDCIYKSNVTKANIFIRGGRRNIIESYYPIKSKITGNVNVSKAIPDTLNKLPINVSLPRGIELIQIEPREVEVTPILIEEKTCEINVITNGNVKMGYFIKKIDTIPKIAKIKGPQKLVNGIKNILIQVNVSNLDSNFTQKQQLSLVDVLPNVENNDITITPKEAEIFIEVAPLPSKEVNVVAQIVGKVDKNFEISSITCEPKSILIKGPTEIISLIKEIPTEPINVEGISTGIVQNVNLSTSSNSKLLVEKIPIAVTITLKPIYKSKKFKNIPINLPDLSSDYEIILEKDKLDIIINAPINKLESLDSQSISLDVKLPNDWQLKTGEVELEMLIHGINELLDIKPSTIKAIIKSKKGD